MSALQNLSEFLDLWTILISGIAFSLIVWLLRRPSNLPPGPISWPLLGSFPGVMINYFLAGRPVPHKLLTYLSKRYGQLYSLKLGSQLVVVANDLETIKEAGQNQQTAGRPKQLEKSHGGGEGVAISSGDAWLQQRRFTLATLRSFGVGKKSFEDQISEETDYMMKEFEQYEGKPFDPKFLVLNAISNVLCAVIFGKRYEYSDTDFRYIIECLDRQTKLVGSGAATIFFPFAKYLPKPKLDFDLAKMAKDFAGFLQAIVRDHQKVYDAQNLHDYIDVYLKEMELGREVTSHLNELNLVTTLSHLFFAGTDTSATTIRWSLMYMMEYPDIQKKVQSEIDSVVGRDRLPKLSDRDELPFTDAILFEASRIGTVLPLSLPHRVTDDTTIKGYHVPKDSILILNLWACHSDPKLWDEPERFKPERFLDDKGGLKNTENVIPFSFGRRQCIGEQLARKELFIFFSHLMHRFTFEKPDDTKFDFVGMLGLTNSPKPFQMRAIVRD